MAKLGRKNPEHVSSGGFTGSAHGADVWPKPAIGIHHWVNISRDIEAEAQAAMMIRVMTPLHRIFPIRTEAQKPHVLREPAL
jgi:hypothetical protein